MEFRLLGVTEVRGASRPVELPAGRARALLAILALQAGQPVAAERLIDELWSGTAPPTATTVVHGLVSRLRRCLDPDSRVLETIGRGYRLTVEPEVVDAIRFERMLLQSRGTTTATARVEILSAALELWRGPALADFAYEPFAQRTITALEESRIQAAEGLLDAELELRRADEVIPRVRELIAAHPFRERLHGLLMTALYRSGRQAEALDAYRSARELLLDELGIEPGPALRSLEAAILRQDPALDAHVSPVETSRRVQEPSWLPRQRRRVTVAIVHLTPAADEGADAETAALAGHEAAELARKVLASHGGRVERSLGDELVAFFGFPTSHEDDALRAVRAAVDALAQVPAYDAGGAQPIGCAGIETGDILIAGPGGALPDVVTGPVISTARRLALAAGDGDVLVGPGTVRLVSGEAILKPLEAAAGWLVVELTSTGLTGPRGPDSPMIGRASEVSWLRSAFHRAVESHASVRVTVVGHAGIGKSRLTREVVASLGAEAHAITIRCGPSDDALGFHPVRQAVVDAAGVHGWRGLHSLLATAADGASAVGEVAAAVGLRCPPARADEITPPMLRLFEALAHRSPLVVVLDDLHWADPAFLQVIDELEGMSGAVLLIGARRPDLAEDASTGGQGDVLHLGPLTDEDVARLVIGEGGPTAPGALHRIVALAQGNPLYAEQLLAAADDGELDAIPASLVGLLSMRLDLLGPGERDVLRCASVGGLDIDPETVRHLLPPEAGPFVPQHLEALVRKRFIDRLDGGRLRFAHVLIQMAALRSVTLEDRARLQEAFEARPIEQSPPGRAPLT